MLFLFRMIMPLEIERKFLVKGEYKPYAHSHETIIQGYLSSIPERTVRVRIKGDKGFITVKGIGNHSGISRYEWEKEIPVEDAKELINICESGVIYKERYYVKNGRHLIEVDEFSGDNKGLVIAEIELSDENETIDLPEWLGAEVTNDKRYFNSFLTKYPYTKW